MKALTLMPNWAMMVFMGYKTVECRTWKTDYRGDLLICSGAKLMPDCISGHALCVARLEKIEPFKKAHLYDAGMEEIGMPDSPSFAWRLSDVRGIYPFKVKGQQGLFNVPDDLIRFTPREDEMTDAEIDAFIAQYITPLIYKPARL